MNIGLALKAYQQGNLPEAERICLEILRVNSNDVDANHVIGCLYMATNRLHLSHAHLQKAVELKPLNGEIVYNYACVYMRLGSFDQAIRQFKLAASLHVKQQSEVWNNIGYCCNKLDRLDEAEAAYRKSIAADPQKVGPWCNLGNLLKDTYRHEEALKTYEQAAKVNPRFTGVWRGQMLTLLYMDGIEPGDCFARLKAIGERMTAHITPLPQRERAKRGGKLRVGWHSSDLYKTHPVARNLAPFFDSPREGLEYYLYLDIHIPDATTDWYAARSQQAMNVLNVPDKVLAQQIQKDEIDVMIWLSGRMDENRPQVAAFRPAPVNISMFDAATSAVPGMDWFVVDEAMVSGKEGFTERLLTLPNVYVHEPLPHAPEVSPAPRLANGYPTFGCFNNPTKISPRTLALWQRILLDIPDAKLMLHYKGFYNIPRVRDRIMDGLHRVNPERIVFSNEDVQMTHHLSRYGQVDLALDPFPVTGSTTTFEALHQGVPVITLRGDTVMGRWSAGLVGKVAPEFVADTEDAYHALACQWSKQDIDRQTIRDALLASPICQVGDTVNNFEKALLSL